MVINLTYTQTIVILTALENLVGRANICESSQISPSLFSGQSVDARTIAVFILESGTEGDYDSISLNSMILDNLVIASFREVAEFFNSYHGDSRL